MFTGYDSKFWLTKNVFIIIIITIYIITTIIINLFTSYEYSEKQHRYVKKKSNLLRFYVDKTEALKLNWA